MTLALTMSQPLGFSNGNGETWTDLGYILEAELTGLANGLNRHFMKIACYISPFLHPINEMKRVENPWPK